MTDIQPSGGNANSELQFHPLANIFPLMEGEEFDALVADIKANGLRLPIVLFEGKILDGRNRYRAAIKAGIDPFPPMKGGKCAGLNYLGDDPAGLVISANIHRRHLTAEDRRKIIADLLKAKPEASNNAIAKQVKVDDKTVGKVRRDLEARSEIPNVEVRTDTKGRKQPARRAQVSARTQKRREQKRLKYNEEERQRLEHGQAVARQLVDEFGLVAVKRIIDAYDDPYAGRAIQHLLAQAMSPAPDDGLGTPEYPRRGA